MKIFTSILLFIALVLIIFNITLLDFDHFFCEKNKIALIGIVASICAFFILLIFKLSKLINEKTNNN